MTTDEAIGARVHQVMWEKRVTQTALAPYLGVAQSSLSARLRGERRWTVVDLIGIARFLGVEVVDLLPERAMAVHSEPAETSRK